jgi:excisionase family DNA binding protein
MKFDPDAVLRVKAVATALDVSVATIYRAVEAGELDAYKIGTGKGALRITGAAVTAYLDRCSTAASTLPPAA